MGFAGPIIGLPFALEGFAFFTEAIFLGIYLYGWDRISPRAHWLAGVMVAASGAASAVFVVIGQRLDEHAGGLPARGRPPVDVDPIAAMLNPACPGRDAPHDARGATRPPASRSPGSTRSCCCATARNAFHRRALAIALAVGGGGGARSSP